MTLQFIEALLKANGFQTELKTTKYDWGWHVQFDRVEVKAEDGCLVGTSGRGPTQEAATADYLRQLPGQRLIFSAYGTDRRELVLPAGF